MSTSDARDRGPRIGYVLKMYPRFSETFIVTELLAMQELGADLEVFSLRPPVDGRFHASLARVRTPVTYLPSVGGSVDLWRTMNQGRAALGDGVLEHLPELLAVPVDAAYQAISLAMVVTDRRITHLHAHFGSLAATVARLAARLAGITYSCTLHAKDIYHHDVVHEEMTAKLADAAAIITISDFNEQHLRAQYGGHVRRLVRIYNGLDLRSMTWSLPDARPPTVIGVGRLVEKKGFHHLVDAVALLAARGRKVHLEVVGAGSEGDALRLQVAHLHIEEHVSFLGPLTQDEAQERIKRAAVLAAPCVVGSDGNRDGLPTVILESLALGTPVVATPVTGVPEAVIDGRTGLVVPEGDVPALADAIGRLFDDVSLRCALAVAGRRHVENDFDVSRNVAQLYQLMREISWDATGVTA